MRGLYISLLVLCLYTSIGAANYGSCGGIVSVDPEFASYVIPSTSFW